MIWHKQEERERIRNLVYDSLVSHLHNDVENSISKTNKEGFQG